MCPIPVTRQSWRKSLHVSADPHQFIAYAPRGIGLLCAVVYAVRGDDVCGWWAGEAGGEYQTGFFLLDKYFSREDHAFYATRGGDLYGGWVYDYQSVPPELDKPIPVDDALCHELERMQFVFAQEWLWFAGDADAEEESARYHEAELAHDTVNVKFHRLNKLDKDDAVWTHLSHGADAQILRRLMRQWPLDCRNIYGAE